MYIYIYIYIYIYMYIYMSSAGTPPSRTNSATCDGVRETDASACGRWGKGRYVFVSTRGNHFGGGAGTASRGIRWLAPTVDEPFARSPFGALAAARSLCVCGVCLHHHGPVVREGLRGCLNNGTLCAGVLAPHSGRVASTVRLVAPLCERDWVGCIDKVTLCAGALAPHSGRVASTVRAGLVSVAWLTALYLCGCACTTLWPRRPHCATCATRRSTVREGLGRLHG